MNQATRGEITMKTTGRRSMMKITSIRSLAIMILSAGILGIGVSSNASLLMLDFGPNTVTGAALTNSPYVGSSGETTWNKVQLANITSGLLYADGTAASGISIKLGRSSSTAGNQHNFVYAAPGSSLLLGGGTFDGVYFGTNSVGRDGITYGTPPVTNLVGASIVGLAAGTYEVYTIGFNANKTSGVST
jgi:hypothetical protein